jgi:hypothetical protein
MDETKTALPSWLPWATTACLAVLLACVGEISVIEKTRGQLARDENLLLQAEIKASRNQLEAERIVTRRELENLRSPRATRTVLLSAQASDASRPLGPGAPWGVVIWDPSDQHAVLCCSGLPVLGADRDYQVWIEGPAPDYPVLCGYFNVASVDGFPVDLKSPVDRACRILLIDGKKGENQTLEEVKAAGSIVLATPPRPGKISN